MRGPSSPYVPSSARPNCATASAKPVFGSATWPDADAGRITRKDSRPATRRHGHGVFMGRVDYKSAVGSRQSPVGSRQSAVGSQQSAVSSRSPARRSSGRLRRAKAGTLQLALMPIRPFGTLTLLLGLAGCTASPKNTASAPSPEWFTDVAQAAGLDFTHVNGMSGRFYYPEIMAPGVAPLRLRQRRRPRRLRHAGAVAGQPTGLPPRDWRQDAVPKRYRHERRRHAHDPLHGRDDAERDRPAVVWHGRRGRRLQQRRVRGPVPDGPLRRRAASQQRRRHVHRRDEGRRHGRPGRLGRLGDVLRLRPRRLARPVRGQLPASTASPATSSASASRAGATTARRTAIARSRATCSTTGATARSRT